MASARNNIIFHYRINCRLGLLLGCLLSIPLQLSAQTQPIDRIVAIVDSDVILASELDDRLRAFKQRYAEQEGQLPLPPEDVLSKQILDRLILNSIQLQMGAKAGIRIGDEGLLNAIKGIAQNNRMTLEQFQDKLLEEGMDYHGFREQVRQDMIIQEVQRYQLSRRIRVTPNELQSFLDSPVGQQVVSDDYLLGHILIPVKRRASSSHIDKAKNKALDIYQKALAGESFRELAKENSAGAQASRDGSLGWRKLEGIPDLFSKQVIDMEVGEVLEPIRSSSGFHVVSLLDKRGPSTEVENQSRARHILIQDSEILDAKASKKLIHDIYTKLQNKADFSEFAKRYSDDPGTALAGGELGWLSKKDLAPGFAEVMETIELHKISQPFQTDFGWHVLQVLERREHDVSKEKREQKALDHLRMRRFEEELKGFLTEIRNDAYIEIK